MAKATVAAIVRRIARRKGARRDNVFVERLWRTIKHEEVYLHAYDSVSDSRSGLARYLALYSLPMIVPLIAVLLVPGWN